LRFVSPRASELVVKLAVSGRAVGRTSQSASRGSADCTDDGLTVTDCADLSVAHTATDKAAGSSNAMPRRSSSPFGNVLLKMVRQETSASLLPRRSLALQNSSLPSPFLRSSRLHIAVRQLRSVSLLVYGQLPPLARLTSRAPGSLSRIGVAAVAPRRAARAPVCASSSVARAA